MHRPAKSPPRLGRAFPLAKASTVAVATSTPPTMRRRVGYLLAFTIACLFIIVCNLLLYREYAAPVVTSSVYRQPNANGIHPDDIEAAITKAFKSLRLNDVVNDAVDSKLRQASGGSAGSIGSSKDSEVVLDDVGLGKVRESTLCPGKKSDAQTWAEERSQIEWTVGSHGKRAGGHGLLDKEFFCNKIQADVRPWREGDPGLGLAFSPKDIVVGVYSGEKLAFTRAAAVIDTYFADTDAAYAYASTPVPGGSLEFLAGSEAYKSYRVQQPDRRYNSAVHDVNMILIHDMFRRNPEKKWYVHAGCDTYINLDYMAKHLAEVDAAKDLWFASVLTPMSFLADQEFIDYMDKTWPRNLMKKYPASGLTRVSWHGSFGSGINIMSKSVTKSYHDNFKEIMQRAEPYRKKFSKHPDRVPDIAISYALALLGYKPTIPTLKAGTRWWPSASKSVAGSTRHAADSTKETWWFHYISPHQMLRLDQFFAHQKLDRMINQAVASKRTEDIQAIFEWYEQFYTKHKAMLERRLKAARAMASHETPWPPEWSGHCKRSIWVGGMGNAPKKFLTWFRAFIDFHFEVNVHAQIDVVGLMKDVKYPIGSNKYWQIPLPSDVEGKLAAIKCPPMP